jgi:hypothetical protein
MALLQPQLNANYKRRKPGPRMSPSSLSLPTNSPTTILTLGFPIRSFGNLNHLLKLDVTTCKNPQTMLCTTSCPIQIARCPPQNCQLSVTQNLLLYVVVETLYTQFPTTTPVETLLSSCFSLLIMIFIHLGVGYDQLGPMCH